MTDPLDRLLREAAGNRPDPELSRRAIRASLRLNLGRRRQRDARTRAVRPLALAAALLVALCGQLGSDDFEITVETMQKAGQEMRSFHQGLRGEEVRVGSNWAANDLNDEHVGELLQQKAADQGVLVGIIGWQLGRERKFTPLREFKVGGKFILESPSGADEDEQDTAGIKAFLTANRGANVLQIFEIKAGRAPDFDGSMSFEGLKWDVNGWRIRLPGREEIIYYEGLRADGVRAKDSDLF